MELLEAIRGRRSIRRFTSADVSDDEVREMLGCAIMAPSAGNLQPWEFVVIRDEQRRRDIARAAFFQFFIATAPVVIVVCANRARSAMRYGRRGSELYCLQDTAAATQNMLLTAHSMGLGACWIGAFDEGEVSRILRLPEHVRPVAIVPIGHPDEAPRPPPRIPLERVTHLETFRH